MLSVNFKVTIGYTFSFISLSKHKANTTELHLKVRPTYSQLFPAETKFALYGWWSRARSVLTKEILLYCARDSAACGGCLLVVGRRASQRLGCLGGSGYKYRSGLSPGTSHQAHKMKFMVSPQYQKKARQSTTCIFSSNTERFHSYQITLIL